MIYIKEVKANPKVPKAERVLPHGCPGKWEYSKFSHKTYTAKGEEVIIGSIRGYRCNICDLVAYLPPVGTELNQRIAAAEKKRTNSTKP